MSRMRPNGAENDDDHCMAMKITSLTGLSGTLLAYSVIVGFYVIVVEHGWTCWEVYLRRRMKVLFRLTDAISHLPGLFLDVLIVLLIFRNTMNLTYPVRNRLLVSEETEELPNLLDWAFRSDVFET